MTGPTTPSGIATASTEVASAPAWKAFDGDTSYYAGSVYHAWRTPVDYPTGWLAYEFPVAKKIVAYGIYTSATSTSPNTWTLEGTNDGVNWVVLDRKTNITKYNFPYYMVALNDNHNYYKKYRINIAAINGNRLIAVHEFYLFEDGSTQSPPSQPSNVTATTVNTLVS